MRMTTSYQRPGDATTWLAAENGNLYWTVTSLHIGACHAITGWIGTATSGDTGFQRTFVPCAGEPTGIAVGSVAPPRATGGNPGGPAAPGSPGEAGGATVAGGASVPGTGTLTCGSWSSNRSGVPERPALVRRLDGVCLSQLTRRGPPPDPCLRCRAAQLLADCGWLPVPAGGRAADHTQQCADRQLAPNG
jgi:hypothetical protein